MEDAWENNAQYALVKLADRLVPVPKNNDTLVCLYPLCRAWVRNNPTLPLVADAPPPQQRTAKDSAGQLDSTGGLNANVQDASQAPPSSQPTEPLATDEPPPTGLVSILPPLLPPTQLETETSAPTYPLDDMEAQEMEEAQRKLKDHWVAVRQYHQALRRAKLSRHRERLQVLLGEPSSLGPHPLLQAPGAPQHLQQHPGHMAPPLPQSLTMQHAINPTHPGDGMGGPSVSDGHALTNGVHFFGNAGFLPGGISGLGQQQGASGGPSGTADVREMSQLGAAGSVAAAAATNGVSMADAQAALAAIMNLGAPGQAAAAPVGSGQQHQQHQPGGPQEAAVLGSEDAGLAQARELQQQQQEQTTSQQQQAHQQHQQQHHQLQQLLQLQHLQQQQQLQHLQQLGLQLPAAALANGGTANVVPSLEVLIAIQQQLAHLQQQQAPGTQVPAAGQPPLLGQMLADVTAAAGSGQGGQYPPHNAAAGAGLAEEAGAAGEPAIMQRMMPDAGSSGVMDAMVKMEVDAVALSGA